MSDDLRAQVARIQPGDKVTATFESPNVGRYTLTGDVRYSQLLHGFAVGPKFLSTTDGAHPDVSLVSIDSHEPALPPEPPVGSVVVKDGKAYLRWSRSHLGWICCGTDAYHNWPDAADGTVIFTPGGEA